MSLAQTIAGRLTVPAGQTESNWMTLRNTGDAAKIILYGAAAGTIQVADADPGPTLPPAAVNAFTFQIRDGAGVLIDAALPAAGKAADFPELGGVPAFRAKLAAPAGGGGVVIIVMKQYECGSFAGEGY